MSANRCRARFGEALGGRGCRSVSSTVMALLAVVVLTAGAASSATTLPDGFVESKVASLSDITAMAFAPDGRLFVAQQGGQVRVIKNDVLFVVPFLTVTTDTSGERGLVGIAFDPGFAANGYLYVYYTATTPTTHNRVSRFTANGDVAVPESERVILELDTLGANIHNGGAMHFGADGKLYIATGENFTPSSAQTLESRFGKILRINADGTIPLDNPFYGTATGDNRAIWALGLRNPFSFAVQPGTGRIFINDVGESAWEEINEGAAGANYGWPMTEGFTSDPQFVGPIFSYPTRENGSCAGTGGTFYNPPVAQFPDEYVGTYFFLDFCGQWIGMFDPLQTVTLAGGELRAAPSAVTTFAEGLPLFNVHLVVGPDGSLFYASRDEGAVAGVYRIEYTGNLAPHIGTQPVSQIISVGRSGTFSVEATGAQPLGYQWQKSTNGGGRFNDVPGATSASYTTPAVTMLDQGIVFRCVVTNELGKPTSARATLTVTTNRPPTGTITSPAPGSLYSAGATIAYTGTAADLEDVPLPPTAFAWKVDFRPRHPFSSVRAVDQWRHGRLIHHSKDGETATTVYYRIFLRITDSVGLTHMSFRDIRPRTSTITLATSPTGLLVTLDGQPKTAPHLFSSVVGLNRTLGVISPQALNGVIHPFQAWSDGGAATHTIVTPASNTTYTARYPATAPSATLTATPNSAQVCDGSGTTAVTLVWTSSLTTTTEVHIGSPAGPLLAHTESNGQVTTDKWVTSGTRFYLQDVSRGLPLTAANTLAIVTVTITSAGCPSGSINPAPNPVQACEGLGVTTLLWSTANTETVDVRVGSPTGPLFARTGPGSYQMPTDKWVANGTVLYLQNVSSGLPLTAANTLATVTASVTTAGCRGTGTITAAPNPAQMCDGSGLGVTTLSWSTANTTTVDVRLGSPTGPLFARTGAGSWLAPTGNWVSDGSTFYLQNVSGGLPLTAANTLATVTANVISAGCTATITAVPNPAQMCDGSGLGVTTLSWNTANTAMVEVRVGSPTGPLFAGTGPAAIRYLRVSGWSTGPRSIFRTSPGDYR